MIFILQSIWTAFELMVVIGVSIKLYFMEKNNNEKNVQS